MQAQHIRGYCEQRQGTRLLAADGRQLPAAGQCDIRAANYVINAHLRRHDTYHQLVPMQRQRTNNPAYDPGSTPTSSSYQFIMVSSRCPQIREIVQNTPDPLQWGCFQFKRIVLAATISHSLQVWIMCMWTR